MPVVEIVHYLDLDGVLADYAAGMVALGYDVDPALGRDLNRSGTSHPLKREMYERIKGTEFYRHLPLQEGAVALYKAASKMMQASALSPVILTAAPKFGSTEDDFHVNPFWLGAAYHKRAWVETILLPAVRRGYPESYMNAYAQSGGVGHRDAVADPNFICTTSVRKWEFMHRFHGAHQVLTDDRIANVTAWAEAGGIGLFHRSAAESIWAMTELHRILSQEDRRLDAGPFQRVGQGYLYTGAQ